MAAKMMLLFALGKVQASHALMEAHVYTVSKKIVPEGMHLDVRPELSLN